MSNKEYSINKSLRVVDRLIELKNQYSWYSGFDTILDLYKEGNSLDFCLLTLSKLLLQDLERNRYKFDRDTVDRKFTLGE